MNILRHLPNFLTCQNLLFGTVGTSMALTGRPDLTVICILMAAVFDFFDGFAARLLKVSSPIGKDLDSLADLISFGFAPAAAYSSLVHSYITGKWTGGYWELDIVNQLIILSPFVLVAFSALRLAKFNNDSRQTENFIGLTTTATGMFSVSYAYVAYTLENFPLVLKSPLVVLSLIAIFSALLVSEIPMFSLKFKHYRLKGNEPRYILLLISLFSLVLFGFGALMIIIPAYVVYSILLVIFSRQQKKVV